ncbi:MAG: hypothetical protein ABH851_09285 [Methanobacteriota archaeon]
MKLNTKHVIIILIAIFLLFMAFAVSIGVGYYYFTEYSTTTTSTSTSSTSTSTTSTTTTTTTSTSSTSTTTITTFNVCENTLEETKEIETRCYGKLSGVYSTHPMRTYITYELTNFDKEVYNSVQSTISGDTCQYTSTQVRITVGSMETCEIPQDLKTEIPAQEYTQR